MALQPYFARLRDMHLFDLADNQYMAAQVQHVHHAALHVHRELVNQWRRFQFAEEDSKFAFSHFVSRAAGDNTTVVRLFHHVYGWDSSGEGQVLSDSFECVSMVLKGDR